MATVLTLPGWLNSGPRHWQTLWEEEHPGVERVVHDNWETPDCDAWIERLDETIARTGHDVVVAAHSMGCILLARWAALSERPLRGALLVAVPDPDGPVFPAGATGFWIPRDRIPFPTIVVASSDDPFADMSFSQQVAAEWGSRLFDGGLRGHLNGESGLGSWPDGWARVDELQEL